MFLNHFGFVIIFNGILKRRILFFVLLFLITSDSSSILSSMEFSPIFMSSGSSSLEFLELELFFGFLHCYKQYMKINIFRNGCYLFGICELEFLILFFTFFSFINGIFLGMFLNILMFFFSWRFLVFLLVSSHSSRRLQTLMSMKEVGGPFSASLGVS